MGNHKLSYPDNQTNWKFFGSFINKNTFQLYIAFLLLGGFCAGGCRRKNCEYELGVLEEKNSYFMAIMKDLPKAKRAYNRYETRIIVVQKYTSYVTNKKCKVSTLYA